MHVAILGAGTMGHGIAQVSAMAGHDVSLRDIEADIVDDGLAAIESNLEVGIAREKVTESAAEATLGRLTGTTSLAEAVTGSDLVVEAVPEDMEIKHETLTEVESHVDPATLIASNTSSLSLTEIASVLEHPDRAIGLHFFNPVHIMALVEIVVAEQTSAETVARAREFVHGIDKTPVEVTDAPGFASSRLGVSLGVEAMRMVQEGVATPHDIDTAMELGYNHPMGPIELGDVVGLDVRLDILEYLRDELGERFRPPQILKRKVRAGKLGKKSGEGFYVWEDGDIVGTSGDWGDA
ncbi:3-hydroxyacyl-CoA dehydrogenase family protein [Haloarcula sp. CBA1130]|uniref:3-hydroxyacyl-CoA dehydrogenase family protein n=1 Tax=unclassified Haloarcula TaxID=2624677 RepID=UPI0012473A63|nr:MULTISPECIES: 3-hydroxyacyl-CoA dehydrogenase family protein [unclassified Haloarcula]KAA9396223.1 3-hydroxyacyl-CoA dehydrogenase family protein [Haloarcula sp. CBA1129]KAA9400370.1 3-hydroxyacyl-CoA dehydrogenase family protein [Haloarcula sp. CBA1130]